MTTRDPAGFRPIITGSDTLDTVVCLLLVVAFLMLAAMAC